MTAAAADVVVVGAGLAGLAGLAAAVYEEPFWRQEGLSGFAVNDSGPVTVVYDDCPEDGSPGVLVGFIEGEQARIWARRAPADRRAGILACLVDLFGERSGRPRELLEHS